MSVTEAVAIIGAMMLVVSTITGSVISIIKLFDEVHDSREKIDSLQVEIAKYKAITVEFEDYKKRTRTEIVLIGQALSDARYDTAAMALLINQLFDQYKTTTGTAPEVNIEMLRHMRTIGYVTGPLGPLDVEAVKRSQ
jgi:hypothetical protein